MEVIANNMAAILDLANRQIRTDPHLRRLQTFINLQFFACMWGIVPGSLDDEHSPFNECTHAYLAAALETIREMDKVAIGRLVLTNREHVIALEPLEKGLMGHATALSL
jgi:hypothetical protein